VVSERLFDLLRPVASSAAALHCGYDAGMHQQIAASAWFIG
jgi:hypothetical protein